ncbi:hypothetical protein FM037_21645 [Shewanella psychropiezotolerans]|uniref:Uncharacterized protein n=1 Tax=Shewanella psychropiezotolerans TaxID=2593655 RepID=A0ABX5X219_9GAMM|nr:hypothetical protein FM037_21645 [Shewanella psychropiezotolerans]
MRKWLFPFKSMQHRSGNTESLTQCGFQSPLCYVECFRYRITISFKHPPCLQCFELPLNVQILTRNGITTNSINKYHLKIQDNKGFN